MATHCTSIVMETTSSCGLFYLFDFTPHPFGRQWSERLLWLRPQRDYLAAFFLIKSPHCVSLLLLRQPQLLLLLLLLLLPLLLLVENTVCSWQMPKAAAKLSTCNRTKCGRTYCNFESTQLDAILDAIRDARVRLKAVSNASKVQLRSHTHTSTLCALDCSIAVAHLLLKFGVGFRLTFHCCFHSPATCSSPFTTRPLPFLLFCPDWNQVFELTLTNKANCWHVDGLSTISFLLPATSVRSLKHAEVTKRYNALRSPNQGFSYPWLSLHCYASIGNWRFWETKRVEI